jgi:hypothetical protein
MTRFPRLIPALVRRSPTFGTPVSVHPARRQLGPLVIGASIAVVLAACGGGTAPTSPSSVGPGGSPATSAVPGSVAPSQIATSAVSSPGPSVPAVTSSHADPALEALLPAEVSGTPMQRSSATLASLLASGGDRTAVDAFLQSLGKSADDGTFAAAFDPTATLGGGIFAFKIAGVDAGVLLPGIVSLEKSDLGAGATTQQATVGGKSVLVMSIGSGVNDTEWIYGTGQVVFVVHAADEAHAAPYIQALP